MPQQPSYWWEEREVVQGACALHARSSLGGDEVLLGVRVLQHAHEAQQAADHKWRQQLGLEVDHRHHYRTHSQALEGVLDTLLCSQLGRRGGEGNWR